MAKKTDYPNPMFAERLAQALYDNNINQTESASRIGRERKAVCA